MVVGSACWLEPTYASCAGCFKRSGANGVIVGSACWLEPTYGICVGWVKRSGSNGVIVGSVAVLLDPTYETFF